MLVRHYEISDHALAPIKKNQTKVRDCLSETVIIHLIERDKDVVL